ncbi:hypothetical protein AGR7C_Lc220141 [Agrobacterium deltaense Zutra 3/1]|uniref:Uncharacterized protein n=1 Tax=Agrobacterium deltaense Zutra 3/1 TaxID=1183427 RepID=A0A1S7RUK6_9HYPH|nr:hypothetical protein AGR7C_Lc220141 [Agrobacterium deltaense Zutra 3/1]
MIYRENLRTLVSGPRSAVSRSISINRAKIIFASAHIGWLSLIIFKHGKQPDAVTETDLGPGVTKQVFAIFQADRINNYTRYESGRPIRFSN